MTRSLTLRSGVGSAPAAAARTFEFDRTFGDGASTDAVYEEMCPLIKAVAAGSRATVLAYGQTGSGKTYTMLGLQVSPREFVTNSSPPARDG